MEKEKLSFSHSVERNFERHGGQVQLIHTTELPKPYVCTCRLPGKSEESSFLAITDNFRAAHEQFDRFVRQLKNAQR